MTVSLITLRWYFSDLTKLYQIRDEYIRSRPVVSIILIDNYEELTKNLTENAISYSEGRTIRIALADSNSKFCRIIFEDDGVGVDEKNLPRLFERFYRVDKGRSRSKGGTGLGLAIVKHAVLFHGGSITVSNRPEGGLRFEFTLEKQPVSQG